MSKKIVITTGDPAGCGPIITLKAIDSLKDLKVNFTVVGDKKILKKYPAYYRLANKVDFIDLNTPGIANLKPGAVSKLSGRAAMSYLDKALEIMRSEGVRRLVTAPLSKEAVNMCLPGFMGHTEYLADAFGVKRAEMMMCSEKMRAVLFTRHIPLRQVSDFIKPAALNTTFSLVYSSLQKIFKIRNPRVAVVSLNPHAGVNTFLEKEEKTIIKTMKKSRHRFFGPFPSDTVFVPQNAKQYDCIICLYHDQAMIPFKLLSMKNGVNLTLGLPVIRTSPAHGVAYDIIKKGKLPFASSMRAAIELALKLKV